MRICVHQCKATSPDYVQCTGQRANKVQYCTEYVVTQREMNCEEATGHPVHGLVYTNIQSCLLNMTSINMNSNYGAFPLNKNSAMYSCLLYGTSLSGQWTAQTAGNSTEPYVFLSRYYGHVLKTTPSQRTG